MNNFDKKILITATLLAAITIAMGAFGAHGLKNLVDEASVRSFETGVRYQMYHVIALVIIGFAGGISESTRQWVFRFFILGILLFSGSIYLLTLKEFIPFNSKFLGPITPVGGLFFIMGWLRLCYGIIKIK